mmetsp:Transcript_36299/g.104463  ORF Transcript_36299/g.104463 Transcript_36299/m.104463 type:complete len:289 (-) Transcript_36299:428-1294(-)
MQPLESMDMDAVMLEAMCDLGRDTYQGCESEEEQRALVKFRNFRPLELAPRDSPAKRKDQRKGFRASGSIGRPRMRHYPMGMLAGIGRNKVRNQLVHAFVQDPRPGPAPLRPLARGGAAAAAIRLLQCVSGARTVEVQVHSNATDDGTFQIQGLHAADGRRSSPGREQARPLSWHDDTAGQAMLLQDCVRKAHFQRPHRVRLSGIPHGLLRVAANHASPELLPLYDRAALTQDVRPAGKMGNVAHRLARHVPELLRDCLTGCGCNGRGQNGDHLFPRWLFGTLLEVLS